MKELARKGVGLSLSDIPQHVSREPHERGGFRPDLAQMDAYEPVTLCAEAQIIAEIYADLMRGNPIGVSGGLGGLIPEKLLWSQIEAYARLTKRRFNQWVLNLLFLIDGIRLKAEFERLKKEAQKPNGR